MTLRLTVLVDQYPALSETFVVNEIETLHALGHHVHVETAAHAPARAETRDDVPVDCLDDDGLPRRLRDLAWLVARHPRACAADLRARRRWAREEKVRPLRVLAPQIRRIAARGDAHLHAHFAAGVALDALRIGRILGLPYSVMAHAYEIYRAPRNLAEKLTRSAFSAGECEYSVADLRAIAPAADVHVITMGVDHERFRRRLPPPGGREVLAVGRMVEKKGFRHLLAAVAEVDDVRLTLIGDGPLREDLERLTRDLGIDDRVRFAGAQTAAGVRDALERADVLAITAVPVADGDRDVLPLIAGESLAMEVPVVASDFVGLPEVVMPPWGRLAPPGDEAAIAAALRDVLGRPVDERRAMGAAGREFVVRTRDLRTWAGRLASLIAQSTSVR